MSHLQITNVGPVISADVNFKKCTLLIGEQGTGKSTIAKLFSLFTWLEKGLLRHTITAAEVVKNNRFRNKYAAYHNLQSYIADDSHIRYAGEYYTFDYSSARLTITPNAQRCPLYTAKVMYIPAERNLLSVVESSKIQSGLSAPMQTLMEELNKAKAHYAKGVGLPLAGINFTYDRLNKASWIVGKRADGKAYRTALNEAASGYQSLLPLSLVSHYLAEVVVKNNAETIDYDSLNRLRQEVDNIMADTAISDSVKTAMLRTLSARYSYSELVNVVEEMEQNLYPESQRLVLFDLLKICNELERNKLVLTTHSPYLVNYMTLAVKAAQLDERIPQSSVSLKQALHDLVPRECMTRAADLAIYELRDGYATLLPNVEGLPSDANSLNQQLMDTNNLFDHLLDIEEQISAAQP